MPELAIVTDSTAYIPADLIAKYKILVAPQIVIWDGEEMRDGVDIMPAEFYARLRTSKTMPTTSQATIATFQVIFEPLVARGVPILAILVSPHLSGTIQSAEQAKKVFPGARIEIVNSESVAMALGYQVLAAARAAEAGESFDNVLALAKRVKDLTGVVFLVDTLEFLHRGGRIGGASRFLGSALNLKPLLEVRAGRVEALEKVRTRGKARERLLEVIEERVRGKKVLRIATLHAAAAEDAEALLAEATKRLKPIEAHLTAVSPAVGTHAGPGTLGLAYCTEV
ncbi:MAG: DegV family protein [Anaerolineales bacterium]|nr:DegV family protein [Anaerolineales bacterium]